MPWAPNLQPHPSMHTLSLLNPWWLLLEYALKAMSSTDPQMAGAQADAATFLAGLLRVIFDVEKCLVLFSALMFALDTWMETSLCTVAPLFSSAACNLLPGHNFFWRSLCYTTRAPLLFWLVLSCSWSSSICFPSPLNTRIQATNFISIRHFTGRICSCPTGVQLQI